VRPDRGLGSDPRDFGTISQKCELRAAARTLGPPVGPMRSTPGTHQLETTVRYLRIELDDTLEIAEQTEMGASGPRGGDPRWRPLPGPPAAH